MLPQEVVGRYRRYKRGTRKLVYWLVRAVSECGDLEAILDKLPERRKPTSKKGKKKKDRKSTAELAEIEVQTSQLTRLAEAVSKAQPPAEVPNYIISTAREVIAGREECHVWYSSQTLAEGSDVKEQNDTHDYFIQKLKHVLELLLAAQSRLPAPQATLDTGDRGRGLGTEAASLNTTFQWLSVEEPSDNALGDEPPALSVKTSSGAARVTISIPQEAHDDTFQTWCFLQDLNDVRRFVIRSWEKYAQGELSFVNASMVTETAFGLLRRADEDFAATRLTGSTDWQEVLHHLGHSCFVRDKMVWVYSSQDRITNDHEQLKSDVNVTELLCPIAYSCLDYYRSRAGSYCAAQQKGKKPAATHPGYQSLNAAVLHGMNERLWTVIPETHAAAHDGFGGNFILDEFWQGLVQIHATSAIRVWIVVACQVYIDIHELLGEHTTHGLTLLRNLCPQYDALRCDIAAYSKTTLHGLSDIFSILEQMQKGEAIVHLMRSYMKMPSEKPKSLAQQTEPRAAHYSEGLFPAHAGHWQLDIRLHLLRHSCEITGHGSFALLMMHLYRALRAMGPLKGLLWPDMEYFVACFGARRPLATDLYAEYDMLKAMQHLSLDLGCSPGAFAPDRRRPISNQEIKRRKRMMSLTSPLLVAFCDESLAKNCEYGIPYARVNSVEAVLRTLLSDTGKGTSAEGQKRRATQNDAKTSYTPVELLDSMSNLLRDDEPILYFDFIRFTLSCSLLLQEIGLLIIGRSSLEHIDSKTNPFVGMVLDLLSNRAPAGSAVATADLLRAHIQTKGDVFLRAAKGQSSGTLSAEHRPHIEPQSEQVRQAQAVLAESLDQSNTKYTYSGMSVGAYNPDITAEIARRMQDSATENPLDLLPPRSAATEAA